MDATGNHCATEIKWSQTSVILKYIVQKKVWMKLTISELLLKLDYILNE